MANCHSLFQDFIQDISITQGKKDKMSNSKDGLRARIRKYFKDNHPDYYPKFFIQGSYKMKSAIRTKDDICDLDDGVYFFREPDVSPTTLQTWIKNAVDGYTDVSPEHRAKCIRSIFSGDYEIDMPVYYKIDGNDYQLAVKNNGWEDSDPKAMVDWFNSKKDKEGQLVRIVKDLKAWCDYKRNRMPNGLAMSILASNAKENIVQNERDDIYLKDILNEIKKALNIKFECIVPVVPNDNLFQDYDITRKNNFLDALNNFITDAEDALRENNQLKASKLWRKHLGDRFPEGEDKEEDKKELSGLIFGAKSSNPWSI
jgi:hypothetical protein